MKKILLMSFFIYLILSIVSAQEKHFTYKDLEVNRYFDLGPEKLKRLKWLSNSTVSFQRSDSLMSRSIISSELKLVIDLPTLNSKMKELKLVELPKLPEFQFSNDGLCYFESEEWLLAYNPSDGKINKKISLMANAENLDYNSEYTNVAYTLGQNLALSKINNHLAISNDSSDGMVYGQTVHRNEFGIDKGTFWSPCSKYLAFYIKDESSVAKFPLVKHSSKPVTLNQIRYPMAGSKSEEVRVCIYSLDEGRSIVLKTGGDPEQYLTNLSWHPNEEAIYIQQLNRSQNHMHLVSYSVKTGEPIDTLFEEKNAKYIEPLHPLVFINGHSGDFIYQSRQSGFNHLYYYHANLGQMHQLTSGSWEVTDFLGVDEKAGYAYFMSTKASPLERHLYKVDLDGLEVAKLTKGSGIHVCTPNTDFTAFIDTYSSSDVPNVSLIINSKGDVLDELIVSKNPLESYLMGEKTIGTIQTVDGSELYYRLVKPAELEEGAKLPLIVYVYGGPHVQLIQETWIGRTEMWQHFLAQNGYASFVLDTRGSSGRGYEFESSIFRKLGIPQMNDQLEAYKFISQFDFVDTNRIGVHGWSFGGHMAINMMLNAPSIYKVGVAGGPVTDWSLYEVMYGERYMDTPQENPEGYLQTNLNTQANKLQGELLIIHGQLDPVVVIQHSQMFLESCVKQNKQVDFFVYPQHEHNVRGYDRVHLIEMISEYFFEHL